MPTRAYLMHLPGIIGPGPADDAYVRGLREARLDLEVEVYDWTTDDPGLRALAQLSRNRAEARRIAGRLTRMMRDEPHLRVYLSGHSGGGGIAVWVLEELPDNAAVESLLLLAPALSPQYDLSEALRRVRGAAYHFHSHHDTILGAGTRAFGTIDRVYNDAAGRVGFIMPPDADSEQYQKLNQQSYDPAWVALGNYGQHIGMLATPFTRDVIAPLLRGQGVPAREADHGR